MLFSMICRTMPHKMLKTPALKLLKLTFLQVVEEVAWEELSTRMFNNFFARAAAEW